MSNQIFIEDKRHPHVLSIEQPTTQVIEVVRRELKGEKGDTVFTPTENGICQTTSSIQILDTLIVGRGITGSLEGTSSFSVSSSYTSYADTSSYTTAISGSANYISKFTGKSTLVNSLIYDDGTHVGIGRLLPSEILDVNGNVQATGFKTSNGTASQAFTANGGTFDLNTKADLVDGKVPSSQLPSYVGDVLEFANLISFPTTGESGKIYIAIDTNTIYRWSGTEYEEISISKQFVTDSITTAIAGLQDNRLEFNELSDFPAIGDETKFYIDLSEDQIYIWDSNLQIYKKQSLSASTVGNYRVEIISTKGNLFKNDFIETTLIAKVYCDSEDITDSLPQNSFRWKRVSDDLDGDNAWNLLHQNFGSNVLNIGSDDVKNKAVFNCEVNI